MTVFDAGLQPERTELSWRRTALALGVGSLVASRLLPVAFGHPAWTIGGLAGVFVSVGLWLAARRRYRAVNDALSRDGERAALPDAQLIAALAAIVTMVGLAALAAVLSAAIAAG